MSNPQRFPLSWPTGWKRTDAHRRRPAKFSKRETVYGESSTWSRSRSLTVGDGLQRLNGELRRLGASNIVISSNLRLNFDGSISAGQAKVLADPGVAVYFRLGGKPRVLACDTWSSAADNLAAIAGHIEAMRAQERYGVGNMEQAFAGYAALPPAGGDWRSVLGLQDGATRDDVESAYKRLARVHHPDVGGDPNQMARLNAARTAALAELEGR